MNVFNNLRLSGDVTIYPINRTDRYTHQVPNTLGLCIVQVPTYIINAYNTYSYSFHFFISRFTLLFINNIYFKEK